jgi:glycosyltransferase involved in cell wall biosynthesis
MPDAAADAAIGSRPRVLHMLGSLGIGGIETWLLHMFRHHREFSVRHEVLLTKAEVGAYESEIRGLGIPVHHLPMTGSKLNWLLWLRTLRRFLRENGPFDAVHSHLSLFSGLILGAARTAAIRTRIAHCHDARSRGADFQRPAQRLFRAAMVSAMKRTATDRIGISDAAIEEIAGKGWRRDPRARILLYGFDFSKAAGAAERAQALRFALGIGNDTPVVGHVGRFDPVKNHALILAAFAGLKKRMPAAQLVLVGEGPLLGQVRTGAVELGLADSVHLPGPTRDVPAFMALFDLLVLPSFSEGLGIVCLEAQATGTRCLVSDKVPREVAIAPSGVEHLALDAGTDGWTDAMQRMIALPAPDPDAWRRLVEDSRFGIHRCIAELDGIYRQALERAR